MLIDSHVHLNDEQLFTKIESLIDKANAVGVSAFVVVGYDIDSSKLAIELANMYDSIYALIGIHPSEASYVKDSDLEWIEKKLSHPKVKGIGEIGLDYHWDKNLMDKQKALFIKQIQIANKHKMPISVHMRDATEDTYQIIKTYKDKDLPGVMHCYSGSKESMQQFIDLNMYISLAGPVTFKNANTPKEVAASVPMDRLLVETDSPYLAPVPYRGKQNQPRNVEFIAKEIAKIKNISFKELAEKTYENTVKLFNLEELKKEAK
ncbi:MAG: TatD family hydrolase [Candidatus Izemoplasmatales bacterium]|uniref:TatD family hydrolase n=1 Tax=Hujiaoplasma nucleasis TaxID=2725268 RepID=A0A7L6N4T0_9MOLU|nr:TatD family hydrolase [Hujiaoplasma nucleasis]QLY40287.1 TatD family hydrolase [Hujiaoplasma nucleasis]